MRVAAVAAAVAVAVAVACGSASAATTTTADDGGKEAFIAGVSLAGGVPVPLTTSSTAYADNKKVFDEFAC